MHRRTFVKSSSLLALSIGVFGRIEYANGAFIGDTPTTTDALGPFYRPNAPFRTNINPPAFNGTPLHLSGIIYKEDGKTLFKNCLVEIWQCNHEGLYDILSDDYIYRGAAKVGKDGKYHFITTHPVLYGNRPPHIHLRISDTEEYSDLITQIYFTGDPNLKEDFYSSSPTSAKRILKTSKNSKKEDVVHFDIVMSKQFPLDDSVYKKLSGVYTSTILANEFYGFKGERRIECYKNGDLLYFRIEGQIVDAFRYIGNNSFDNNADLKIKFELLGGGGVKIRGNAFIEGGTWKPFEILKEVSY
jgi:protocatechuate 3,4-dioxygenase beta subunit